MSASVPRYALYYAPEPESELARFGARCIGRDAQTGETVPQWTLTGISADELLRSTTEPRRYGFHGTLKAPFRLIDGATEGDLLARLEPFAATLSPFAEAPLKLAEIAGFLALIPVHDTPQLQDLAAHCVRDFDDLRAPPMEAERARRLAGGLTPAQEKLLARWGYPYVMEEFRFHLTLTDKLPMERRDAFKQALAPLAEPVTGEPLVVRSIALFYQPTPDAPFTIRARFAFGAVHH